MPSKQNNSIIDINDLQSIWRIVVKNWYIVAIAILIGYVVGYIYAYKLTNVYAVGTQILLKSNDEYNPNAIISDNSMAATYRTFIDNSNESRVIKSFDLIEKVVKKLDLEVSNYIVGRLRTEEVYEGTPFNVRVVNVNPRFFEKEFHLKIKSPSEYELTVKKGEGQIITKGKFNVELLEPDFKLIIENNGSINDKTIKSLRSIEYLFRIHSLPSLVAKFQRALTVENPEYTNILNVTLEDVIPKRAKAFLDTLSKVYIENSISQRFDINENTIFYIDRQMKDVIEILNNFQDTMQGFKEDYAILDLPREQDDYFEKLSQFDNQKASLILQIGALDDLEDYIIKNKDPEFLPPNIYVNSNDDFLKKSTSELYSLQISRNNLLTTAKEESPGIRDMDDKIDRMKKNLLTYIVNSRKALNNRISDVDQQINKYVGNIKSIPEKQRGLLNIQRKLKVNEDMYLFLLQKRANTIIARAGIIPLTKVIESARNLGIVKPNKNRITLYFDGGSFVLSLIIVFIRVMFYDRVESISELKQKTELPILGEILLYPKMNSVGVPVDSDPKSPIAESFRTIRTNLQYMAADAGSKAVIITSNSPGEGKTFCSINLSAIFAKAGKKVLLLELDLHKPRVGKGLGMSSEIGISTILIGKTHVCDAILPSEVENLDVILSGPIPPNPSELILSSKMEDLIRFGKDNYDFVIIDTPPVGLISDAFVLMKHSEVSLFVMNTKAAYREALNNAHEIVRNNQLTNFGFILNGVKRKKSKYYYNKYSYGKYGYGYGGYGYGSYGGYGSFQGRKNKKDKTIT